MSLDGSQPQPTSGDDFKRLAENAAPRLQQKTKNLFSKFFSSKSSALDSEFSIDESRRQAIKLYERAASEYKIEQKYL
ncbi:MAG: hypothetical protein MHPSP_004308, partial [Paramarteilia canceri]